MDATAQSGPGFEEVEVDAELVEAVGGIHPGKPSANDGNRRFAHDGSKSIGALERPNLSLQFFSNVETASITRAL